METTLRNVIANTRAFLYGGAVQMPLTLAGTLLIIGLFSANYAILFFLFVFLLVLPTTITLLLNPLFSMIFMLLPSSVTSLFMTKGGDVCGLVQTTKDIRNGATKQEEKTEVFSTWSAMIAFFTGYLFTNAYRMQTHTQPANTIILTASEKKDDAAPQPKSNVSTMMIFNMGMIALFATAMIIMRIMSKCESIASTVVTFVSFFYAGRGVYELLASMMDQRIADFFGVANRLLPPSAIANGPIACVPYSN